MPMYPAMGSTPHKSAMMPGSAVLPCAPWKVSEGVRKVWSQRELVPCNFQLWVCSASIEEPLATLQADWKNVVFLYSGDPPPRSRLEAHKNKLGQCVPDHVAIGRGCLCGHGRPTTHRPTAAAQNFKVPAMKVLACLHRHSEAQRKDPIPIATVGIAALQPRQLVLRDVRFLVQGLRGNSISSDRIV